jgi:hypothetical protein
MGAVLHGLLLDPEVGGDMILKCYLSELHDVTA